MSSLPKHKKSADEIAKLRESLGIAVQPPTSESLPDAIPEQRVAEAERDDTRGGKADTSDSEVSSVSISVSVPEAPALSPLPISGLPAKKVYTLRQADQALEIPKETDQQLTPETGFPELPAAANVPVSPGPRAVHSLRKSEQLPLARLPARAPDSSKLPIHRHSEEEIREFRRHEVYAMQKLAASKLSQKAHWIVVIPGYLFALGASVACYNCYYNRDSVLITGICLALSFLIAGYLLLRKPFSRHHAAFIGVMSMIVTVFGILYYFPNLRYGT